MQGEIPQAVLKPKARRFSLLYLLVGVLLLALAFFGYYLFYSGGDQEEKLASAPATTPIPTSRRQTEPEQKTEAPEKTEVKTRGIVTEAKKGQDVAKLKEPISTVVAKSKEVPPAPAAKTKEAASPTDVKKEVASKKESGVQPVAAPLSLRMNIIGQRKETDSGYTEVLVSEGSILRSHDNFQVHLETTRPAYVYILLYDSQGKASQIFPDPKIDQPGFVEAGRKLVVPAKDLWFWLDESTGTETIYVLAAEKPMSDIRGLMAKMEGGDEVGQKRASKEIKERIAVMQRGVGRVTKGQSVTYTLSDGKKIQKVTDVVTGTGSVVRAVSFQHR